MNRTFTVAFILVVLSSFCWAQDAGSSAPSQSPSPNASMPSQQATTAGQQSSQAAVIPIELAKSLDSRKVKQGDAVEARITAELRTGDGTVIPRGSKVLGHVTEASARAKGDASSQLGLAFDKISLKDGKQLPLKASIQAIGPPPNVGAAATEAGAGNASNMPSPGGSSPMGGTSNPPGMGAPRTTFPSPNAPSSGSEPSSSQSDRQAIPQLTPQSTGVVGLHDLQLEQGSILASNGKQVKLEAGSEILLRVQNQ